MNSLPDGWETPTLEKLGLPSVANIDPSKYLAETFELYSVPSYKEGRPELLRGSEIKSVKQAVEPGDILLCKIVPHLNRVWVVQEKGRYRQIASGEWIVIRSPECNPHYIRQALMEPRFREQFMQTVSGVGGSLLRARPTLVSLIQIPLAPVAEQHRIVAKLEGLFGHSKSASEELERVPRLVERYKQAILAAAMTGEDGYDWPLVPLANLITQGPTNGYSPRAGENPNGTLSLKLTATTRGVLDLSDRSVKRLNEIISPSSKFWLRSGDILIQRANSLDYVGVCAIYEGPEQTYIYPDLMIRVRVDSPTLGRWLWRYLGSITARNYFISHATGIVDP